MEKYERNIKVKRILTTIDTNNDGIDDTIAYINQEDLFLPILIKQSIKDLGVYTDYKEEEETVDLGSFWDTNNTGDDDYGTNPISTGTTDNYSDGTESIGGGSVLGIYGCMDMNAPNYNTGATINCCCDYGFTGGTSSSGVSTDNPASSIGGGCFHLSTGCSSDLSFADESWMEDRAEEWCKATHAACSTSYVIHPDCIPNGCGVAHTTGCIATAANPTVIPNPCHCCPGPSNTHHLLTQSECTSEGFACDGTYDNGCNCTGGGGNIFGGVEWKTSSSGCGSGESKRSYRFYCLPD